MNEFTYDSAQTKTSKDLVSQQAAPEATRAARRSSMMALPQNERRWGVEAGALAYKAQYEKNLNALHDDFCSLAEQLRVFMEILEHTVTSLESHEDSVVAAQRALMGELESPEPSAPIPDALKEYHKGPGFSDGDPVRPYAPGLGRAKEVWSTPDNPLYERPTAVANLNTADQGTFDMDKVRSHIETAKGIAARVRQNPGITGMIKIAIERKLDSYVALSEMCEKNLITLRNNHEAACNAMTEAVASFGTMSKSLISHHEMKEWYSGKEVSVAGETIPRDTYYANPMEEWNRQREEAAGAILDKMNNALNEAAEVAVDSGHRGNGGGSESAGSGGIGGGSHSSASSPRSIDAGGASGGIAGSTPPFGRFHPRDDDTLLHTTRDPRGGTGNLQWPRDMLKYPINARMAPDGPVGGYVPADVLNAGDPRWRTDYSPPGFASGSGAKTTGIAGEALGAGALATKGVGDLNAVLPLGAARAGAPGSALRSGTMPYGCGEAGGAGGSKEKENSRDTKGYKVVRVYDDASRSVDSLSFGADDAAFLCPLDTDDEDAW